MRWYVHMRTPTTRNRIAEIALASLLIPSSLMSLAAADLGYGMLYGMAVSHDGRLVATGGPDGAFLWDLNTGQMIRRFPLAQDPSNYPEGVVALAFSPDDQNIAAFCERDSMGQQLPAEVRLWAVGDGSLLQLFQLQHRTGGGVDFSPDGSRLMAYHNVFEPDGSTIKVWDLADTSPVRPEPDRVHTLAYYVGPVFFSQSGDEIMVWGGLGDRRLSVLAADTGEHLREIGPFPEETLASLGRNRIATLERIWEPDETSHSLIQVFDTDSGDQVVSMPFDRWLGGFYNSPAMVLSEDGRTLAAAYGENVYDQDGKFLERVVTTLVKEVDSAEEVRRWKWSGPEYVLTKNPLAFVPNRTTLILQDGTCNEFNPLEVWDWQTGEMGVRLAGHSPGVWVRAVAEDGTRALLTHLAWGGCGVHPGGYVALWDVEREEVIQSFPNEVGAYAVAEDLSVFLDRDGDGVISLWDVNSAEQVAAFASPFGSWALSTSGDLALGAGADTSGTFAAKIFDATDGSQIAGRSFGGEVSHNLRAGRFLSDGRAVLTADDTTLVFWDFEADIITEFEVPLGLWFNGPSVFAVSPDGSRVLTPFGLWDTATTEALARFDPPYRLSAVGYSPDGRWVAAADTASHLVILNARTGRTLRTEIVEGSPNVLDFSTDGFINVAGNDGSGHAQLSRWDVRDLLASPELAASPSGLEVRWELGTLQFSPTVSGPWIDVPAASPMPVSPIGDKGFFRVKVEGSRSAAQGL